MGSSGRTSCPASAPYAWTSPAVCSCSGVRRARRPPGDTGRGTRRPPAGRPHRRRFGHHGAPDRRADPGDVSVGVEVRFGAGPSRSFIVDTGSSQSVVAAAVATAQALASTDLAQRQATVCSTITVPLVRSGPWSVPGVRCSPSSSAPRTSAPSASAPTVWWVGPVETLRLGGPRLQRRASRARVALNAYGQRDQTTSSSSSSSARRGAPARKTPVVKGARSRPVGTTPC